MLRLNVLYRGIAKCSIGDGSSVTFWGDIWTTDILSTKFPRLYSFAINLDISMKEIVFAINPDISVKEIVLSEDLDTIFQLSLSEPAFEELLDL